MQYLLSLSVSLRFACAIIRSWPSRIFDSKEPTDPPLTSVSEINGCLMSGYAKLGADTSLCFKVSKACWQLSGPPKVSSFCVNLGRRLAI
jgi:hypothetical protein